MWQTRDEKLTKQVEKNCFSWTWRFLFVRTSRVQTTASGFHQFGQQNRTCQSVAVYFVLNKLLPLLPLEKPKTRVPSRSAWLDVSVSLGCSYPLVTLLRTRHSGAERRINTITGRLERGARAQLPRAESDSALSSCNKLTSALRSCRVASLDAIRNVQRAHRTNFSQN